MYISILVRKIYIPLYQFNTSPFLLFLQHSDIDAKENLLHGSMSSITEPIQTIREGLPRPRSGEFRALFEGNTP